VLEGGGWDGLGISPLLYLGERLWIWPFWVWVHDGDVILCGLGCSIMVRRIFPPQRNFSFFGHVYFPYFPLISYLISGIFGIGFFLVVENRDGMSLMIS
jgi:hypothetical protein